MALQLDFSVALNVGVATLAGLAVGIERQWSGHAAGPAARFAGARTFLLLGLMGGIAGWLAGGGAMVLGAVMLAAGSALTVAAYVMTARRGAADVEGTTEVAALAVLALGTVAGLGFPLFTSAAVSLIVLALVQKSRIHDLIRRIGEQEMAAALQFAVLALVVLPLLPAGPYGPYDSIRPRALWMVVLLFSGLSFAGYLARRAVGPTVGYGLTGLLGGLFSSTAVAIGFARRSRAAPALSAALALGAVGASAVVVPRVLLVSTILNPALAWATVPFLVPALVVGGGGVAIAFLRDHRHRTDSAEPAVELHSPLGLWSAIKMAVGFQLVLLLIPVIEHLWAAPGVLASAAVVGITDMDALTLSMARMGTTTDAVVLASRAIGVGALASTLFKLLLAVALGSPAFRRRAGLGLAAIALTATVALWLAW